ncbi:gephyrin-like molybdotransferase Glp [Chthonobacter rhizosphaerae]|uniref:molybdopterin molybdotransferase MoeA n=1 Tax=Chthonobacter rhizosphaerae TaxID=2735553 RepID=UPI0015EE9D8D|nr:gephyrin-like molybdotransferase Glp [Chthonobacter rhizosphaerae]
MTSNRRLLDDCFLTDKERMTHGEALALITERVAAVAGPETVPVTACEGRILAESVVAPMDVPLSDNAAVDGYAYASSSYEATGGFFPVVDRIAAGHPRHDPVPPGAAVRIFTGAAMPAGVDTVAMQEDCETHDQDRQAFVIVPPGLKPGANRRRAGEDLKAGTLVMGEGIRLRAQEAASLASFGRTGVQVRRRLRVATVSTGDEIVRPGAPIRPGQVYDSNQALLTALLAKAGAEVTDLGVLADRFDVIRDTLADAATRFDVIITSGGASRGEEDHVVTALDEIGRRHLWQIAVKPGRPMTLGQIGDCVFLGLPGNPVAVFACFLLYGLPLFARLEGAVWREPVRFPLPAAFEIARKKPDRREFLRGRLATGADGRLVVEKFPRDGSGLITGLREADGFIDIPEPVTAVAPGDLVSFVPFTGFF